MSDAVDALDNSMRAVLADTFGDLRRWLLAQVSTLEARDGKLVVTGAGATLNLVRVRNTLDEIGRQFRLAKALEKQRASLLTLAGEILGDADEQGLPATFAQVSQEAIRLLVTGADRDLASVAGVASDKVGTYLRRSIIGGGDKAQLVTDIAHQLDITEQQAVTLTSTALHSFNRVVTTRHAQEAGVDMFLYTGPDDASTRPWCDHWVGHVGTIDEFEATADQWGHKSQPTPVMAWGGGWRCRHRFVPMSPRRAAKYERGPR